MSIGEIISIFIVVLLHFFIGYSIGHGKGWKEGRDQGGGYKQVLMQMGLVCVHCGGWTKKLEGVLNFKRPYDRCCEKEGEL